MKKKRILYIKRRAYEDHYYTMEDKAEVDDLIKYYYTLPYWKRGKLLSNFSDAFFDYFLNKKKYKSYKKKKKKKILKSDKTDLNKVLYYLNTCFTINKNVKQKAYTYDDCDYCGGSGCSYCEFTGIYNTTVDYDLRDKMYEDKTAIIIFCISEIQKKRLPIKYGKNDGIVYFEYCNHQVSFHDPNNRINCKSFNGEWNEIPNTTIPFYWVNKEMAKI